jgi:hypothetical protein
MVEDIEPRRVIDRREALRAHRRRRRARSNLKEKLAEMRPRATVS